MSLETLSKTPHAASEEDENVKTNNSDSSEFKTDEIGKRTPLRSLPAKRELVMEEKSVDSSAAIDLEELLAQTYPKEASTPINMSSEIAAQSSVRRSKRAKTNSLDKAPEKGSDSSKKWSGEEEICLARVLLECTSPEGDINIAAFYQQAKEALNCVVSTKQLYDKMRGMKTRFLSIKSKLKNQNISEEIFSYKAPHEPALFAIWKRLWGNNNACREVEAENPRNPKNTKNTSGPVKEEEEEDTWLQSLTQSTRENGGRGLDDDIVSAQRRYQTVNVATAPAPAPAPAPAAVENPQSSGRLQKGVCVIPVVLSRMKELVDAVNSVEEFPYLGAAEARELQQKWRRIRIQEVIATLSIPHTRFRILIHEAALFLYKAELHAAHYFSTYSEILLQKDLDALNQCVKKSNIFCEQYTTKDIVSKTNASSWGATTPYVVGAHACDQTSSSHSSIAF